MAERAFGRWLDPTPWIINPKCTALGGRGLAPAVPASPRQADRPRTAWAPARQRKAHSSNSLATTGRTPFPGPGLLRMLTAERGPKGPRLGLGGEQPDSSKRLGRPAAREPWSRWQLVPALNAIPLHLGPFLGGQRLSFLMSQATLADPGPTAGVQEPITKGKIIRG